MHHGILHPDSGRSSKRLTVKLWCRVRRGASARHPSKYVLDDQELERVSALARIELEDARVELERAHKAANQMGKGAEGEEADDIAEEDEEGWVE